MNTEIERIIEDLKDVLFLFKIRKEIDLNKSSVAIRIVHNLYYAIAYKDFSMEGNYFSGLLLWL